MLAHPEESSKPSAQPTHSAAALFTPGRSGDLRSAPMAASAWDSLSLVSLQPRRRRAGFDTGTNCPREVLSKTRARAVNTHHGRQLRKPRTVRFAEFVALLGAGCDKLVWLLDQRHAALLADGCLKTPASWCLPGAETPPSGEANCCDGHHCAGATQSRQSTGSGL